MLKIKKLIFVMFLSISLGSQELDSSFLNSLPEDIKNDVLAQNAKKDDASKLNYKPYLYFIKVKSSWRTYKVKRKIRVGSRWAWEKAKFW